MNVHIWRYDTPVHCQPDVDKSEIALVQADNKIVKFLEINTGNMITSVSLNSIYHLRYSDWKNIQHDVRTESEANACKVWSAIYTFPLAPPEKQVTEDMNVPTYQPPTPGPLNWIQ